jgi:hypothetical protein
MRIFVNRGPANGCTYYRQLLPIRHLARPLADWGILLTFSKTLEESKHYDAYFFSRYVEPVYLPVLLNLKRRGSLIIWDLDDDLLLLERNTPERQPQMALQIRTLQLCLELADVITVSTEHLAEVVNYPDKTMLCPNLIDLDDNPPQDREPGRRAILFTGSPSHLWDIDLVKGLYTQTKRSNPWYFYGYAPKWMDRWGTYIPWSAVHEYPRVNRLIRPAWSICPLEDCKFNRSKSAIKVWETALLGADIVASNVGPYAGHFGAIVRPGQEFTVDHLEAARGNWRACQGIAEENSWQAGEGVEQWAAMFSRVADLAGKPCKAVA